MNESIDSIQVSRAAIITWHYYSKKYGRNIINLENYCSGITSIFEDIISEHSDDCYDPCNIQSFIKEGNRY